MLETSGRGGLVANRNNAGQIASTIINNGDVNYEIEEVCDEVKSLRIIVRDLKSEIRRLQDTERRQLDIISDYGTRQAFLLEIIKAKEK